RWRNEKFPRDSRPQTYTAQSSLRLPRSPAGTNTAPPAPPANTRSPASTGPRKRCRTRESNSHVWQAARIPETKAESWPLCTQLNLKFIMKEENCSRTSPADRSPACVFFVLQRAQHRAPHARFGRPAAHPVFPLSKALGQEHFH